MGRARGGIAAAGARGRGRAGEWSRCSGWVASGIARRVRIRLETGPAGIIRCWKEVRYENGDIREPVYEGEDAEGAVAAANGALRGAADSGFRPRRGSLTAFPMEQTVAELLVAVNGGREADTDGARLAFPDGRAAIAAMRAAVHPR